MQFFIMVTNFAFIAMIILGLVVLFLGILVLIAHIIQHHNYKKAEALINDVTTKLKETENIVNFKVIYSGREKIPTVTIKESGTYTTEIRIPDNPKKIIKLDQAIKQTKESEGLLSNTELEDIKEKLSF